MNHQHRQTPNRDAKPEKEGGQVALNELRWIGKPGKGEGRGGNGHEPGWRQTPLPQSTTAEPGRAHQDLKL